ncbi:MAG: hypothetical protein AB1502_02040 [Thermodesulfobacteriota bacterium]
MKTWIFNPHTGGVKISPAKQLEVRQRIERHAASNYAGQYIRLGIRFRGALCYVDAFTEPLPPSPALLKATGETKEQYVERLRSFPTHLGRLRYFGGDRWSYAFYTYSNERYEPTVFHSGGWFGTPEEAFDIGASYLRPD